jgi:cell division inhibitor SulA
MKTDEETQKVLSDGEELVNMTASRGWSIASKLIGDKILDLQNIANIDDDEAEKAVVAIKARKMAAGLLFEFLKEITGMVEGHAAAKEAATNAQDDGFIIRP